MKALPALAALMLAATPALAMKDPEPVKQDSRIRIVPYDPNNVTKVVGRVGETLTLEFPAGERVEDVALSDSKFLQKATKQDNIVYFKAMMALPVQPVFIKTLKPQGGTKLYVLQFEARADGDATYLIRFTDPTAAQAAAAAAWQARERAKREAEAAEALRRPAGPPNDNYSIQGRSQRVTPEAKPAAPSQPKPAAKAPDPSVQLHSFNSELPDKKAKSPPNAPPPDALAKQTALVAAWAIYRPDDDKPVVSSNIPLRY